MHTYVHEHKYLNTKANTSFKVDSKHNFYIAVY